MNKLKRKIFILLVSILSTFLITILLFTNITNYLKEYKTTEEKLLRISETTNHNRINEDNIILLENEIYIVKYNLFGEVVDILTNTSNSMTKEEISILINKNIKNINNNKIGNLYINKYVMLFNNNQLIILNNTSIRNYLLSSIIESLIVFIILELLMFYLSSIITKKLVKPVDEMFNKQKQFIYDAQHELKTPIAIIQASAETLEVNKKNKKWLDNIKEESTRMNKLVTNLLELSKSEDIKNNEEFKDENISKLIEKKALSFESLMFERNLKLALNVEKNIIFNCNQDRIKELLSILIDNAIKHGIENTKIEVNLKKIKNNIIIEVINEGEEIPNSEREKIFERFYRIDKSRNREENRYGLGLSIAKNIVINHDGIIKVECEKGLTKFIINFKQK